MFLTCSTCDRKIHNLIGQCLDCLTKRINAAENLYERAAQQEADHAMDARTIYDPTTFPAEGCQCEGAASCVACRRHI